MMKKAEKRKILADASEKKLICNIYFKYNDNALLQSDTVNLRRTAFS